MNPPQARRAHADMDADAAPFVLAARDGAVLHLQLNRPERYNVLSDGMLAALSGALDEAAADTAVRVVVLGGSGKAFCAGHDLKQMQAITAQDGLQALFAQCTRLMMRIQRMPQPVIARVHGIATAAGCQLVAMCDLAVASDDARFAVSGIDVGLFCSTPSVALTRNVARKQAFEMLVTGTFIDAQTACARGLVNRVVPADALDAEVAALASAIVSKPAAAIGLGKALFYRQLESGIEAAYQLAGQTMACNMMDASAREGIDAFLTRRPRR